MGRGVSSFRVMTYNVHRCVGLRGRDTTRDVAEVCRAASADIIALQELDAPETDADEGAHHARDIAAELGMKLLFCRTFRRNVGFYGHALLSRTELALKRVTTFASTHADSEPRGAIWARTTLPSGQSVDVISTHLGVRRSERALQSQELLGKDWLASPEMGVPHLLCGDFNAVPRGVTYRRFTSQLRDAQRAIKGHRPRPTFPSKLPVVRLDHVFVSEKLEVRAASVPYDGTSRRASDHLPLIVDLALLPGT
ncbi:MAG: Endonuclease/exonuclease/phosphatase [Labilithrix sp.]|nr:Endonuclease/exonuclease/phosphatase [Labilithrix sp.]